MAPLAVTLCRRRWPWSRGVARSPQPGFGRTRNFRVLPACRGVAVQRPRGTAQNQLFDTDVTKRVSERRRYAPARAAAVRAPHCETQQVQGVPREPREWHVPCSFLCREPGFEQPDRGNSCVSLAIAPY